MADKKFVCSVCGKTYDNAHDMIVCQARGRLLCDAMLQKRASMNNMMVRR